MQVSEQALRNREYWDREADEYQRARGLELNVLEPVWGTWSIAEAELGVLGDVGGKDVLELGCGAAQWSIALAMRGARVVGSPDHSASCAGLPRPMGWTRGSIVRTSISTGSTRTGAP